MAFLKEHIKVRIGNIEWPAYLDILTQTNTEYDIVPFTKENNFHLVIRNTAEKELVKEQDYCQ